jgi:hypothetical protein
MFCHRYGVFFRNAVTAAVTTCCDSANIELTHNTLENTDEHRPDLDHRTRAWRAVDWTGFEVHR